MAIYSKTKSITVTTGEKNLVFYYSRNLTNHDIVGTAIYNVTPNKAGNILSKFIVFVLRTIIKKTRRNLNASIILYRSSYRR
ncbi:cytochrome c oxidase assembly CtaG/Cox11 family protein [Orientia tsutsugamushi str. UT76]|nr:cytochrome c oxidase assembly CtaG/Cox11 family protein [Orientia tsutsugamushi str. UT76]